MTWNDLILVFLYLVFCNSKNLLIPRFKIINTSSNVAVVLLFNLVKTWLISVSHVFAAATNTRLYSNGGNVCSFISNPK